MLDVGARLDYGPRAVLQIGLHLLGGRIWGLFRRDIAHDRLQLGVTFHKLIDYPCHDVSRPPGLKCRAANGRRRAHPPQLKQRYGLAGSSLRRW
jgi:hypothetical protein